MLTCVGFFACSYGAAAGRCWACAAWAVIIVSPQHRVSLASVQKKVRDVKFCRETARVATVSADGTLMVLDAQLGLIRTVRDDETLHMIWPELNASCHQYLPSGVRRAEQLYEWIRRGCRCIPVAVRSDALALEWKSSMCWQTHMTVQTGLCNNAGGL